MARVHQLPASVRSATVGPMNREQRLLEDEAGPNPILFYKQDDEWGCFSNFSLHRIATINPFNGLVEWYRTGEHRFQAMKATSLKDHHHVMGAPTAFQAKERGGPRGIVLRDGWGSSYGDLCYYVMFETVLAKAIQNHDVWETLMDSGDRYIYEDSPVDDIWGWRYRNDYRGKNLLGRCWMEVREVLRVE